jgi:hypothetical protein
VTTFRGDFGDVVALIAAAVALAAGLGDGLGEDVIERGSFEDELGDAFG